LGGGGDLGAFAAGFHQRRIHQGGALNDITARLQLLVKATPATARADTLDQPLPKTADGGFRPAPPGGVQLDKTLENSTGR